ncbi:prepilin-type N-terminal cleavage/methylation domain-containing protein [Janthinobacterium sp.]|uniref:type II secretion system protein n=1 Tax=Janthinobacterium sp. TaxID=1871054 RepID=UPI002583A3BC|nr:prepilin-type N-terminal cleavage/methylation domain-containing protein [Janthinobacterium sp.]MCX7289586.1 prepilin-type N-terminal cleavage/methylation domain-containing protein [Janthinobacterium sp.]
MVTRPLQRGFTLIELLVVMALIGMLLSLSVPRYFGNVDKAKESVLRQNLAQTRDAIDKYFGDNGRYPDSLDEIVTRRYLRKLPVDPITDRSDSWVIVAPEKKDMGGVFDVRSGATGRARDGSEYASW